MTESDFRLAEKYIPDFKGAGFRETVLLRVTANMTGEELAKKCHMSNTVFREKSGDTVISGSGKQRLQVRVNLLRLLQTEF